jgi:hypothetical protein
MTCDHILMGYFHFIESDKPGVIGEIISASYGSEWADSSDIPVYRLKGRGETKGELDENMARRPS